MPSFLIAVLKTQDFDTNTVKTFIHERQLKSQAAEKSNCMIKLRLIEDYSKVGWTENFSAIKVAVLVVMVVESE